MLALPSGRDGLAQFVADEAARDGEIHDLHPAQGAILLLFRFPFSLLATGAMFAEGTGPYGRILLQMKVVGAPGDCQIDSILWE